MLRKIVSGLALTMLLVGMLTLAFNVQLLKASGTIYIRPDGSVAPPYAPIQRDGDLYIFTDNIYDQIVAERDNIVINGAGYAIEGEESGTGVNVTSCNVTIKNMEIKRFELGIYLAESLICNISGNNVTNNSGGILFHWSSNNNSISGNYIAETRYYHGIVLHYSSNNIITGNNITANNDIGIFLNSSSNNNVASGNNIIDNHSGIGLEESSNNIIYGNNITNNYIGIYPFSFANINSVYENNITENNNGIRLENCLNNSIFGNSITNNVDGISLDKSSNNNVSVNNVANNEMGIELVNASDNSIYHNNFVANALQASSTDSLKFWMMVILRVVTIRVTIPPATNIGVKIRICRGVIS